MQAYLGATVIDYKIQTFLVLEHISESQKYSSLYHKQQV